MPKILMLKTIKGADDGIHVKEYVEGNVYDVGQSLAKGFMKLNVCEMAREESIEQPIIEKANIESPKNKAKKNAPKNKSYSGD